MMAVPSVTLHTHCTASYSAISGDAIKRNESYVGQYQILDL